MDKIKTANILLIIAIVMVGVCIFANRDKIFSSSSKVASSSTDTAAPAEQA